MLDLPRSITINYILKSNDLTNRGFLPQGKDKKNPILDRAAGMLHKLCGTGSKLAETLLQDHTRNPKN